MKGRRVGGGGGGGGGAGAAFLSRKDVTGQWLVVTSLVSGQLGRLFFYSTTVALTDTFVTPQLFDSPVYCAKPHVAF